MRCVGVLALASGEALLVVERKLIQECFLAVMERVRSKMKLEVPVFVSLAEYRTDHKYKVPLES